MQVIGWDETGVINVVINGLALQVPDDISNRHRRDVAEWEALGNIIPPYVPQPPVLTPISGRQVLMALRSIDITAEMVEAEISLIADPMERDLALIEWRRAGMFERDHPLVAELADAFSLPAAQVDNLWLWASSL